MVMDSTTNWGKGVVANLGPSWASGRRAAVHV